MAQLGGPMTRQAHHRDRAGAQQREQRHRELAAIRQLQQYSVAGGDAQLRQRGRCAVCTLVELGVAQTLRWVERPARVEHRRAIRPLPSGFGQDRIHRPAGPVTGGPVARRAVWRKRHKACQIS